MLLALLAVPLAIGGYVLLERRRHRQAAAFATPALVPNLVGRSPGRLRHLAPALALLALAALAIGLARPHAMISVKQEQATVVLAMDTSKLDGRDRRAAEPARGRAAGGPPLPRQAARGLPRRHGLVRAERADGPARDGEPRGGAGGARGTSAPATAPRSARGSRARSRSRSASRPRRGRSRRRRSSSSPTAPRRRACSSRRRRRTRAKKLKIPVYTVAFGTDAGRGRGRRRQRLHAARHRPARPADAAEGRRRRPAGASTPRRTRRS